MVLCDNLEGWNGVESRGKFKGEGTYAYTWLIHVVIWQKPAQYYKAIIVKKKNKFKQIWSMNQKH